MTWLETRIDSYYRPVWKDDIVKFPKLRTFEQKPYINLNLSKTFIHSSTPKWDTPVKIRNRPGVNFLTK